MERDYIFASDSQCLLRNDSLIGYVLDFLDKKLDAELASFRAISFQPSSEAHAKTFLSSSHSSSYPCHFDSFSLSSTESACGDDSSVSILHVVNLSLILYPLASSFEAVLESINHDFDSCLYFDIRTCFLESKLNSFPEIKYHHTKP